MVAEYTSEHILECKNLIGQNELATYIPTFADIYQNDVKEQIYIARIMKVYRRWLPVDNNILIEEE